MCFAYIHMLKLQKAPNWSNDNILREKSLWSSVGNRQARAIRWPWLDKDNSQLLCRATIAQRPYKIKFFFVFFLSLEIPIRPNRFASKDESKHLSFLPGDSSSTRMRASFFEPSSGPLGYRHSRINKPHTASLKLGNIYRNHQGNHYKKIREGKCEEQ